jgi:GNAT superfamily N-acetyltransferase
MDGATANHAAWTRMLATHIEGGAAFEIDGCQLASTGTPVPPNGVMIVRLVQDPERVVRKAMAFFAERGLPGAVIVRDGGDPWAERACEAAGLRHVATPPMHVLHPLPEVMPEAPPWLTVRRATTPTGHAVHVRTDALGFRAEPEMNDRIFARSLLRAPGYEAYTGYVDGDPVATATLLRTGAWAGIYGVATVESHRRRGIATAMTWHAIGEAMRQGCEFAYLQPSPMGRPVYEAMGFRLLTSVRIWALPGG